MEYYSAIKKKVLIYAPTRMKLKNTMLGEKLTDWKRL